MITETQAYAGIKNLTDLALKFFLRERTQRNVEQQKDVFDGVLNITNVITPAQEKSRVDGEAFEPDMARAEGRAKTSLEWGISQRLKGAYACYRADMELECIRHILIALDEICCAIGWQKASNYLNEQNRLLLEMKKKDEAA